MGLIQYLGYSPIYWETFVANTTIPISTVEAEYVAALLQVADIFTKALCNEVFLKHGNALLGSPPTGELLAIIHLASTKNSYLDQRAEQEIDTLLHYYILLTGNQMVLIRVCLVSKNLTLPTTLVSY